MSKQAKVLTQPEMKRLLAVVKSTRYAERNKLIVCLSFWAGLRAVEIATLRVSDVLSVINGNWEIKPEVLLRSHQTKGNKAQTVILSSRLRAEIKNYLKKRPLLRQELDSPLLKTQKRTAFSSQTIQHLFRELFTASGLSQATSHSGRRTFITALSEKGVSVRVIQELARHSSMATTQRYIDVSADKLRSAVELATL